MTSSFEAELDLYVQAAVEKKAQDVVVLDLRGLTSIADAFIICSGRSNRQVGAIADQIQRFLKKKAVKPLGVEGQSEGHWVLLDYGHVIIHVFYDETRRFYDLEGFWADAKRVVTPSLEKHRQAATREFDGEEILVE
ncbi:MAG: ribosome silencing factor [Desulfobacteraceae bacterium]|nr:ribosome silencing factor [Desulfobacteraceae bacterium]